ncbi:3-oxoacyl-ACP synthase III family protein [Streptomyces termitum]|uniref:3-oxoacyl-[acyl-carrier-protein] synthase 3 n=1 Tax=Streptomyces termitum TaxID=67368 RepID=A0A918WCX3_9ACTN|nr:ketoacyl-ACP synthase III [Streptomyces termitum]GHB06699.1 3-oxoacyl-[acyl-carrier-protein] synthase 3 [Streptomyces termitum]
MSRTTSPCVTGVWYTQGGELEPSAPASATTLGVLGTGSYLPSRTVANDEIASRTGVTEEWILRKTGIRSRHYAAAHEATSDLAAHAARAALADAGIRPGQLSYVMVATSTPDHPQPATAAIVQHLIGAENAAAFDVNAVCTGFLFALNTAHRIVPEDGYGLVIGADIYSRIVNPTDRRTAVLFGDGAGAVVIGPVDRPAGLIATNLRTFGDLHRTIEVPAGGSRLPARHHGPDDPAHYFAMHGRAVRDFVTERLPSAVKEILRDTDTTPDSVQHFIPHQANGQMLQEIAPTLGLDHAVHHLVVESTANTGAASVPLTLDLVNGRGALKDGDTVLLSAFGGGMSIGTTLLRWAA